MIKVLLITLALLALSNVVLAEEKAAKALAHYGFTSAHFSYFQSKYSELADLDVSSESLLFSEDADPEIFSLKIYAENSDDAYVILKNHAHVEIEKIYVPLQIEVKSVEGEIRGNLFDSLNRELNSKKLVSLISSSFKDEFTTTKGLRVKATYAFDVIAYFDNGHFVKYGDVLKTSLLIGQAISKKILQQDPATLLWNLLPEIIEKEDRPFYAPVKSSRVSSLFQLIRRHPVKRRIQPHNGIDFVASSGTPVFPALDGEILTIGRARAKGKFIVIEHDNGYKTTYDHLKKFQKGLRVGMRVEMHDQIGEVGRTGYATGAHLHFGVLDSDNLYVNPIYLVKEYTFDLKDNFENSEQESEGLLDEATVDN